MLIKKQKIAHIRTSHGIFGAERVILGLLKDANQDTFEQHVILVGSEPGLNRDFANEIARLNVPMQNFLLNGRFDLNGIRKISHYIRSEGYNIIHCHDFKANFYGLMATLGTDVRRVTTVHGSTKDSFLLKLYLNFNEYFLVRFFDKIIAVSEHLAEELSSKYIPQDKIAIISNGIDVRFFDEPRKDDDEPELLIPPGKKVVGIIGRLFPDKGHRDLFKALQYLEKEFPELILLVVGGGPEEEALRLLTTELGIQSKVIFAGVRHNMKKVFDAIDIFAMPSLREGLPLALLEAMLAGKPVVATRVGGMPALLGDGQRGRVINASAPEELTDEIRYLLFNMDKAKEMAERAASFVRSKYSADNMGRRTESVYKEILQY